MDSNKKDENQTSEFGTDKPARREPASETAEPVADSSPQLSGSVVKPTFGANTPEVVKEFIKSGEFEQANEPTSAVTTSAGSNATPASPAPVATPDINQGSANAVSIAPVTANNPSQEPGSGNDDLHDNTGVPMVPPPSLPKSRKKWLKIGLPAVIVILLLCGAYAFGFYLPNTPGRVYDTGLKRSGLALDKLISYAEKQDITKYASTAMTGNLQVKSGSDSFDGNFTGSYGVNGDSSTTVNADDMGEKFTASVRTIKDKGNTNPDIYVQVSGIKHFLDSYNLQEFDSLDGQWIAIDHTLLDTYKQSAAGQDSSGSNSFTAPTIAQINDAIAKVQTINKRYIFTTDKNSAVLTHQKFLGTETKNGRQVDHYQVGYNKTNLRAYVGAVKVALDSSQLNGWSNQVEHKNLSQAIDFDSLDKQIQNANSNYTFDLWIDKSTKLISSVQFTDPTDQSVFTISQSYTGGDIYPFTLNVSGKNDDGSDGQLALNIKINTKTNQESIDLSGNNLSSSKGPAVTGNFVLTPSDKDVQVTAPKNAKPIVDILGQLGLSSSDLTIGSQAQASDAEQQSIVAEVQADLGAYVADNNGEYPANQAVVEAWLNTSPDGNKKLASQFTAANGYTYQRSGSGYVITYKDSSGKTVKVTQDSNPDGSTGCNSSSGTECSVQL